MASITFLDFCLNLLFSIQQAKKHSLLIQCEKVLDLSLLAEYPTGASFWCLYCSLWIDFTYCSSVSIVDFEQANAGWVFSNIPKRLEQCHWRPDPVSLFLTWNTFSIPTYCFIIDFKYSLANLAISSDFRYNVPTFFF